MILSRNNLKEIKNKAYVLPEDGVFALPEKVLQFGTGVLLRGLPDYFIDKANRQGIFNGRIVVVKSTSSGSTAAFDTQDSLYTIHVRGIEKGEKVAENIVCSAVSRVLSAADEWESIIACAHSEDIQIIISNTTEIGITLVEDDISTGTPVSFPGKLLAFLLERFKAFQGSAESGMVIVPTELIVGNGSKLKGIVLELASQNGLGEDFIRWLTKFNTFCDSLVDRIVPGRPDPQTLKQLEEESGYQDDLRFISEVYRLWAIQGDSRVAEVLSFSKADAGVIIAEDIEIYRELKLRLLNGTHSLSCGIAFLAGFDTVKAAMADKNMEAYISGLMISEITPAIPYEVPPATARAFSMDVLDRFRNPQLEHQWLSISLSFSAKLKMRVLPVLLQHYRSTDSVPEYIALGFAAYIRFMSVSRKDGANFMGETNGRSYPLNDDKAALFYEEFSDLEPAQLVNAVLEEERLWDNDLTALPGFEASVKDKLNQIRELGMRTALENTIRTRP